MYVCYVCMVRNVQGWYEKSGNRPAYLIELCTPVTQSLTHCFMIARR